MTKFADQLLNDLMDEYRPALQDIQRPAAGGRGPVPRRAEARLVAGEQTLRPRTGPPHGGGWWSWLAPLAAAAGVIVAVGLAVSLAGTVGRGRPTGPVSVAAGQPRYYVEAGVCCGRPVVRSAVTGRVTATVPVPVATARVTNGYGIDEVVSARDGTFFVTAYPPQGKGGQRIYRFRLTRSGRISGFAAVPGALLGNRLWEADAMAASPDGSRVAVAFYYDGSSRKPNPDYIVVVNTKTGAQSVWRGGTASLGPTFSVASMSWTGDGRELVFLGQYCRTPLRLPGASDSEGCGGGHRRIAQVRTLDPASSGGRLDSGRLLLGQSARLPYIAQALISPGGSTITAVVLRGPVHGSASVGGFLPRNLSVEQISVATGAPVRVLYRRNLGSITGEIGAPDCLILSQDIPGQHWMLNGGISGRGGDSTGFNGWIHHGRLVPLPPADGYVAAEAW
jgi:hypothetical protein